MFRRTFFQAIASLAACCGIGWKPKPTRVLTYYEWRTNFTCLNDGSAKVVHYFKLYDQFENCIQLTNVTDARVVEIVDAGIKQHTPMIDVLHQLGQVDRGCHI